MTRGAKVRSRWNASKRVTRRAGDRGGCNLLTSFDALTSADHLGQYAEHPAICLRVLHGDTDGMRAE